MKKQTKGQILRRIYLVSILFIVSMSSGAKTQNKEKIMSNEEQVISVVNDMAAAMKRGDLDAVMSAYESGASLVVQPGMTVYGPAVREAMNGFTSMKPKFDMPKHEVILSGDIALHIAPWTMEAVDPTTGIPIKENGFSIAVLRKQSSGKWLILIDNPYGANLMSK